MERVSGAMTDQPSHSSRPGTASGDGVEFDLASATVRDLNHHLHEVGSAQHAKVRILNPAGMHNIAVGVNAPLDIEIVGHAGYFIAGMNQQAKITIHGNVGWSVGENMMSGLIRVKGNASQSAGASAHGGLLVVEGDAGSRCGISLKGGNIVVGGSVGHMSAFMAQAGTIVVCQDAGANLGDSLYEAVIYVRGKVHSLGTDAREEPMTEIDHRHVADLLAAAEMNAKPTSFRRYASAKTLYHWNVDAGQEY